MTRWKPRPLTDPEKEHLVASCWCRRADEPCRECRRYFVELGRADELPRGRARDVQRCRCADAGAARASDGWRCTRCGRRIDDGPGAAA